MSTNEYVYVIKPLRGRIKTLINLLTNNFDALRLPCVIVCWNGT